MKDNEEFGKVIGMHAATIERVRNLLRQRRTEEAYAYFQGEMQTNPAFQWAVARLGMLELIGYLF